MLPTSLAYGWVTWRQHRVLLMIALGGLLVAAAVSASLPAHCTPETAKGMIGLLATILMSSLPVLVLGVFTYGLEGADLNTRASCFPQRLFLLPVRTPSLVVWPIVYGAALTVLLWLAVAWFVLRPWTLLLRQDVPLWWPAVFLAAALAMFQAVLWTPFGLPGLRLVLLLVLVPGLVALGVIGASISVPESTLAAVFGALAALGWAGSFVGVHVARRGAVPNWEALLTPFRRFGDWWSQRAAFPSAASAQRWFEWRINGGTLPTMTAMVMPAVLMPLLFERNDVLPLSMTLLGVLVTPLILAAASGWQGYGQQRWTKDRVALSPLLATLPLSTADLLATKMRAAAWSALAAWLFVFVVVPPALLATGRRAETMELVEQAFAQHDPAKRVVGSLAVMLLLFVATWKRKIDGLFVGLTGRPWIIVVLAVVCLPASFALLGFGWWLYKHPDTHEITLLVLPWLLGAVVLVRLLLAGGALRESLQQGLLRPATVQRWLAAWLLTAILLFAPLAWAAPAWLPTIHVAFAVLFALPLARLAASPLALAWNRHR